MRARRGRRRATSTSAPGPGKLTQALGIELSENATSLVDGPVRLGPRPRGWRRPRIAAGERIGITRAADLPWRFMALGHAARVAAVAARGAARRCAAARLARRRGGPAPGARPAAAGGRRRRRGGRGAGVAGVGRGRRGLRRRRLLRRRRRRPAARRRSRRRRCAVPPASGAGRRRRRGRLALGGHRDRRTTGGVVGVTGSGGRPSFARSRSARAWSSASARVMKACQMIAGKVPPSTGPPWNSVFIGLKPCG